MFDSKHGVKMGVSNGACDDAKVKTRIALSLHGNSEENQEMGVQHPKS